MQQPFISIITATYNAADDLPCLIESLAGQTFKNFEWLVQDNCSSDPTIDLVKRSQEHLALVHYVSEKDSGVYDAWNRALKRASGEWILFLGADDRLDGPEFMATCKRALEKTDADTVFGLAALQKHSAAGIPFKVLRPDVKSVYANLKRGQMVSHPSLFHRRCIFTGNTFDTSFRIAGDYDFICRVWRPETLAIDITDATVLMGGGGLSNSSAHTGKLRKEVSRVLWRHSRGRLFTPWYLLFIVKGVIIVLLGQFGQPGQRAIDRVKRLLGR